jgi:hypothetical protein
VLVHQFLEQFDGLAQVLFRLGAGGEDPFRQLAALLTGPAVALLVRRTRRTIPLLALPPLPGEPLGRFSNAILAR